MTGDYKECQDGWEEVRFLLRGVGYLIGLVLLLGLAFLGWWFCTPLHKFKSHMLPSTSFCPSTMGLWMDNRP